MPRPHCLRRITRWPGATYFKPAGIPLRFLEEVTLALDEFEAVRLADLEGLYQEQAAKKMKISRPTFSRVVESGRRKIADALVNGRALRIEGGAVNVQSTGVAARGACGCGQRKRCGARRGATDVGVPESFVEKKGK
jgi:uncharacterized protein